MTPQKFQPHVRKHVIKHYGSLSAASRHFGGSSNLLSKCFAEHRRFPEELLEEMGYQVNEEIVRTYSRKKRVIEDDV